MKNKKILFTVLTFFLTFIFSVKAYASTSISVKSNSSVTVGNTITTTVTISSSEALG